MKIPISTHLSLRRLIRGKKLLAVAAKYITTCHTLYSILFYWQTDLLQILILFAKEVFFPNFLQNCKLFCCSSKLMCFKQSQQKFIYSIRKTYFVDTPINLKN